MADPFDFSTQDPNSPGLFGLPVSAWQDLARFGANLASGANARTATGHLANGTGFAGPFGSAVTATMDSGRQNAIARSGLAHQAAETQGLNLQNQINALGLPFQRALSQARMNALANMQGGGPAVGGASGVEPSGVGPPGLGAAEGGNNPAAVNGQGFSGQYQFGAPRLAELGLYQPAQGEPMNSNKWTGQFNIPGFPDVKTQADFLGNQQAQNAAYQAHMQNIDQAIQSTPGAANLNQNGLRAVAHLGGVHGMQQFIATGGQYNPHDANGTHLSDYYEKFSGQGATSPSSGPRAQAPGSFEVAQAGGTAPPMPSRAPQPGAPQPGTPDARAMAQRLRAEATSITQQANNAALLGNGLAGDPQILRQSAMEKIKLADALDTAGPMEAAKGAAGLPSALAKEGFQPGPGGTQKVIPGSKADPGYIGQAEAAKSAAAAGIKPETDRYGNMYTRNPDGSWNYLGRGSEVKEVTDPSGAVHFSDVGGIGIGAQPPITGGEAPGTSTGPLAKLSPAESGRLHEAGKIEGFDLEHDRKTVETDLAHVVDNTIQGKLQMLKLRTLIDPAHTGFLGETRMAMKNAIQTLSPSFADAFDLNASPAQELKKIATMGAGKSEREDQGAKGGLRLMQIYMEANPNLENQPDANKHMANMILMAHQLHEDYALGANDFYQKNRDAFVGPEHKTYSPISKYDQAFIQKMRPEVYKSATDALNGKPYAEWSKGLTGPQMQIVGGILQRADPNAQINIQDRMVPVNAFTTTISPMDIMGGPGGR